jgi:azurin
MKYPLSILAGIVLTLNIQMAFANDCQIAITANDALQFSTKAITVPGSCKEVTLTLNHIGTLAEKIMGHNWVLTKASDLQGVVNAGNAAGLANNYLPTDDPRVLAATDIIGGGEQASVTFSLSGLSRDQKYTFFCSFPGHWVAMQGVFNITE